MLSLNIFHYLTLCNFEPANILHDKLSKRSFILEPTLCHFSTLQNFPISHRESPSIFIPHRQSVSVSICATVQCGDRGSGPCVVCGVWSVCVLPMTGHTQLNSPGERNQSQPRVTIETQIPPPPPPPPQPPPPPSPAYNQTEKFAIFGPGIGGQLCENVIH